MKITESRLRQIIREEITVGDVRKALDYAQGKSYEDALERTTKVVSKKLKKTGIKTVLSLIPGAAGAWEWVSLGMDMKDLYDAATNVTPKEKKKNALWDKITIDPEVSDIVDDDVEAKFIQHLGDTISGLPDDDVLPDADTQLSNWVHRNYKGTQIKKPKED
jgi:hypothetical protein